VLQEQKTNIGLKDAYTSNQKTTDDEGMRNLGTITNKYPSQWWEDPGAYIRSSDTINKSVSNALVDAFTYYMNEHDKAA
jgi:enhancer of polycomb-like protein